MGLADRDYMSTSSFGGGSSYLGRNVVFILIAINTIVFFLIPADSRLGLYDLALSSYGIKNFKFWQFVSYMFLQQ